MIIPSLLSINGNKAPHVSALSRLGVEWFHYDVTDGQFVPETHGSPQELADLIKETNVLTDVHLMVSNPELHAQEYLKAGAKAMCCHIETETALDTLNIIRKAGCKTGIALSPETPATSILDITIPLDYVLVLGVKPGACGREMEQGTHEKIEQLQTLREKYQLGFSIRVDGAVNIKSAPDLHKSGAQEFVAGSAIFNGNYIENIAKLAFIIKSAQ